MAAGEGSWGWGWGYGIGLAVLRMLSLPAPLLPLPTPPGFVEFEDPRDAEDAVRKLDGFRGWVSGAAGVGGAQAAAFVPRVRCASLCTACWCCCALLRPCAYCTWPPTPFCLAACSLL